MMADSRSHTSTSASSAPQAAAEPSLLTVTERPYNAETPLEALAEPITPTRLFYVRSNFAVPKIDLADWRLRVYGEVDLPESFTWDTLRTLPERTVTLTMECAGNGRQMLSPMPSGTPWDLGAVSTAVFTGTSLCDLLDRVRPHAAAREVVMVGADGGEIDGVRVDAFERSLPLPVARDPDVMLAWAINGEPLPPEHGFPLRLVVPGWYGMASVKWLLGIRLVAEPFRGHFQSERYVYVQEQGLPDGTPVTRMRVRSLIATPGDGDTLPLAPLALVGSAWSGYGRIRAVEVSTDGGATWTDAELGDPPAPHAATPWRHRWTPSTPGSYQLVSRAVDDAGNRQPLQQVWNQQGYGNNMVQRVRVEVREG
jgi:DMSO/TMAO reductase YedYZ molybdopterin-dependent catalytic subunit